MPKRRRPRRRPPRRPSSGSSATGPDRHTAQATANLQVAIGGQRVDLQINVPAGPARVRDLLPVFQGVADVVAGVAEQRAADGGQQISCRKGCGACCRQLVPVSPAEAHALARLVTDLPEPRRSQVVARFAAAVERFGAAGLLEPLRERGAEAGAQLRQLGLSYFYQRMACPFLEDESCSIHRDRPLACREYLVTSPATLCADPTPESVRCVPMPARPAQALREAEQGGSPGAAEWVPLVLALEHAAARPEDPPARSGPDILRDFFARLTSGATALSEPS
jgi:Fe-S-cluster containining protein